MIVNFADCFPFGSTYKSRTMQSHIFILQNDTVFRNYKFKGSSNLVIISETNSFGGTVSTSDVPAALTEISTLLQQGWIIVTAIHVNV